MKIGDLMQKFFMSNPKRAMWFLSTMPASFFERQGRKKALETFYMAVERVSAYRDFLKKQGVRDWTKIKTFEDFKRLVPTTNKRDYILKYPMEKLLTADLPAMHTFSTSSGTTGNSVFWFRTYEQDRIVPKYAHAVYQNNWQIDKYSTLFIVTYALGTSVAGVLVSWVMKQMASDPNLKLTVATPGSNLEQVLMVIKQLGPKYDQVILAGYPSFVKLVIDEGEKEGIDWKKLNLKLQVAGEAISEIWRSVIKEKVFPKNKRENLDLILDVYGTADAGGLGFGFLLTNLIRDLAREDQKFCEDIFGRPIVPTIVQFNPLAYFIEPLKNGHLAITYHSGMPLVRYDIEDIGGIIPFEKMMAACGKFGYNLNKLLKKKGVHPDYKIWPLPFVYVYFRESAISIASANVYPTQIEEIIHQSQEFNSFKLTKKEDKNGNLQFIIYLELKRGKYLPKSQLSSLKEKYYHLILNHLTEKNPDFGQAYSEDPKSCDPLIKIYSFKEGPFAEDAKRTKPRLII